MINLRAIVIAIHLIFIVCGPVTAEFYKWVDEKGRTHFSDHPPQDSGSSGNLKVIPTYDTAPQSSPDYRRGAGNPVNRSYEEPLGSDEVHPRKEHIVELYVTSWCPYCKKARNFFLSRGIPFSEYDIEKDRDAARRKNSLDSRRGVPFAVINGQKIHGFLASAYENALNQGQ